MYSQYAYCTADIFRESIKNSLTFSGLFLETSAEQLVFLHRRETTGIGETQEKITYVFINLREIWGASRFGKLSTKNKHFFPLQSFIVIFNNRWHDPYTTVYKLVYHGPYIYRGLQVSIPWSEYRGLQVSLSWSVYCGLQVSIS